jgi:hypothetical protein
MKMRRAAIKEYLRAARRIAREMKKSCQSTCTLAQARTPVNAMARRLSGSGSSRSPHLILNMGFRSFPKSSPPPPPLDLASSSSSILSSPSLESWLNPSLFSANGTRNLVDFLGIWNWVLERKEGKLRLLCGEAEKVLGVERIGSGSGGCERGVSPNMSLPIEWHEQAIGFRRQNDIYAYNCNAIWDFTTW